MKHRRKFLGGRRPNKAVVVISTAFLALTASGAFAFQAYAQSNGNGAKHTAAQQDWRRPHHPRPTWSRPHPTPTRTRPTSRPTASPTTISPTTEPATTAPATTATPTPGTGSGSGGSGGSGSCALPFYPTAACTGVPAGWTPKTTQNGDLSITKAGTVVEDVLVKGSINVKAENVTIRNTRVYGTIDNFIGNTVSGHLQIEDTEVVNPPGQEFSTNSNYAFGVANYTCVRCKVVNRMEGFRVGARNYAGAGPVVIQDSFAQLAVPPGFCQTNDPHGDGIQSYDGPMATIKHNTIDQRLDPCPTAPVFIPDQSNDGGTVTDNVLAGGSYALRLTGGDFPAVTGNKIVNNTAAFGPLEVACNKIDKWSGNATVTFDWAAGKVASQLRQLDNCN